MGQQPSGRDQPLSKAVESLWFCPYLSLAGHQVSLRWRVADISRYSALCHTLTIYSPLWTKIYNYLYLEKDIDTKYISL